MYQASWDIRPLLSAAPKVEFVNTNLPYPGSKPYTRFKVPNGGHLFAAYDLNTAYDECDVLVSMTEDEGARHRGNHRVHEELLRHDAQYDLRGPCGGGRAPADSARREAGDHPRRPAPASEELACRRSIRRARARTATVCRGASPTWRRRGRYTSLSWTSSRAWPEARVPGARARVRAALVY